MTQVTKNSRRWREEGDDVRRGASVAGSGRPLTDREGFGDRKCRCGGPGPARPETTRQKKMRKNTSDLMNKKS